MDTLSKRIKTNLRSYRRQYRKYLIFSLVALFLYLIYPSDTPRAVTQLKSVSIRRSPRFKPSQHHVVVLNWPIWHGDVWMYLAGNLQSLGFMVSACTECDGRGTSLDDTCTRFDMLKGAVELGYYNGERYEKRQIAERMATPGLNGKLPSVVFMTTEIQDMQYYGSMLWDIWKARPADQKFKVVALHHEDFDDKGKSAPFAAQGALEYLTIAPHVTVKLKQRLFELARTPNTATTGYDHVPVNHIYPIVDVTAKVIVKDKNEVPRREHSLPSRAIIVGKLEKSRRDYLGVFAAIEAEMTADPALWGYKWNERQGVFEPIDDPDTSRFKLILFGEHWDSDLTWVYGSLKHVVHRETGKSQEDFYNIMAYIDVQILAWKPDSKYYQGQASGGIFRAVEVGVPIFTTADISDKYTFLDQEISIRRSHAISDIEAIRWFRKYPNVAHLSITQIEDMVRDDIPDPVHPFVVNEIATMLHLGWRRTEQQFKKRRQEMNDHSRSVLLDIAARSASYAGAASRSGL